MLRIGTKVITVILVGMLLGPGAVLAQEGDSDPEFKIGVKEGFQVDVPEQGSGFGLNVRVQQQAEAAMPYEQIGEMQLTTEMRRIRLMLSGYTDNGNLSFLFMPAFDRGVADLEIARIRWMMSPTVRLTLGQFKLPMTREFLTASKNLPMVDRSFIDARFRQMYDLGMQIEKQFYLGQSLLSVKAALTGGEGPNTAMEAGGYNYTVRTEFFPTGSFKAYLPSDLSRSDEFRFAIAAGLNYNDDIHQKEGVVGQTITYETGYPKIDMLHLFADFIMKKQGLSLMGSMMNRRVDYPEGIITDLFEGTGYLVQAGIMLKENVELTARHGYHWPRERVEHLFEKEQRWLVGISRFFEGHDLKVQGDVGFINYPDLEGAAARQLLIRTLFQIDF